VSYRANPIQIVRRLVGAGPERPSGARSVREFESLCFAQPKEGGASDRNRTQPGDLDAFCKPRSSGASVESLSDLLSVSVFLIAMTGVCVAVAPIV